MRAIPLIAYAFPRAVNAIVFYGLSLNSTNLSGNKYLNFALVCLIEIPGYSLAWVRYRCVLLYMPAYTRIKNHAYLYTFGLSLIVAPKIVVPT